MAVYQTMSWSPGDEVTSQKMQQMADNDQYLKDSMVLVRNVFTQNSAGKVANGRVRGTNPASRIESIAIVFDAGSAKKEYDVRIPLPPVFTKPPLVFVTPYVPFYKVSCRILRVGGVKYVDVRVSTIDNSSVRMSGELNLLAVGM